MLELEFTMLLESINFFKFAFDLPKRLKETLHNIQYSHHFQIKFNSLGDQVPTMWCKKVSTNKVWNHSQDRELTRIQLRSNVLTRKIETWYRLLQLYIPSTVMLRERHSGKKSIPPYDVPLWLPSGIGKLAPMDPRLADIESRLRDAQAHEALGTL